MVAVRRTEHDAGEAEDVGAVIAVNCRTAGRRGPTYALMWEREGVVYTLTGYGNSGDAVPLASSFR